MSARAHAIVALAAGLALVLAAATAGAQAMGEYGRLAGGSGSKPRTPQFEPTTPRTTSGASPGGPRMVGRPGQGGQRGVRHLPAGFDALPDSAWVTELARTLADPSYQGRALGTAELDSARDLIAGQMRKFGLLPVDDHGLAQPVQILTGASAAEPCTIEFGGQRWHVGDAFQPLPFSSDGSVRAPVVSPSSRFPDENVRGRIVLSELLVEGWYRDPFAAFAADLQARADRYRKLGAVGMLVVDRRRGPVSSLSRTGLRLEAGGAPAAVVSASLADALLATRDSRGSTGQSALTDSVTLTITLHRNRVDAAALLGRIPPRALAASLTVAARYSGDDSAEGPDDGAAGTAAMLGVARELQRRAAHGWKPQHALRFCAAPAPGMIAGGESESCYWIEGAGAAGAWSAARRALATLDSLDALPGPVATPAVSR